MHSKYFWAAIFWTVVIAVCCLISMRNFDSVETGVRGDKYVHFTFYFIFTMLWYLFLKFKNNDTTFKIRLRVFILAFVFGLIIEACQEFFTKDRSADILDVVANTSGSLGAILTLWLADKFKTKKL